MGVTMPPAFKSGGTCPQPHVRLFVPMGPLCDYGDMHADCEFVIIIQYTCPHHSGENVSGLFLALIDVEFLVQMKKIHLGYSEKI